MPNGALNSPRYHKRHCGREKPSSWQPTVYLLLGARALLGAPGLSLTTRNKKLLGARMLLGASDFWIIET